MNKLFYIYVVIMILLICTALYIWDIPTNPSSDKIDSLKTEISVIDNQRDSILREIDTIIIELERNDTEYKKAYNTIISNSTSEDYVFFSKYIEWNRERHDSLDNK